MKTLLFFAAFIFATTGASLCDDFKTLDGKEYKNATVSRTEPDGIVVTTSSGIIKLYFLELPQNVRTKYHYDPEQARQFAATDARKQQLLYEQAQRDRAAHAQQQPAAPTQAPHQIRDTTTSNEVPHEVPQEKATSGTALDQRPSGTKWFLQGHVAQVIEGEGILLQTVRSTSFGIPEPRDNSLVFVAGSFPPTLDWSDVLAMEAAEAGTQRYTTVQGIPKTVAAFQFVTTRQPLAPFVYDNKSRRYIEQ